MAKIIYSILIKDSDTLNENDFDTLYDIILARPKFELNKIILHYDKILAMNIMRDVRKYEVFINYMKKMRENKKNISNLEIHLHYNKHLEKNKNENVEIFDILIRRVETNDKLFSNEGFKEISNQIISFCDNISNIIKGDLSIDENGVASSFTHAFAVLIINSDFKSESVSEFANEFFNKCLGESKDFQEGQKRKVKLQRSITIVGESKGLELPEYIKRMLIITGLAGKKKYREDLANRMKHYIEKDNMNLTDLIVIHYGTDVFQILKSMDELFAEEKINEDLALRESVELKIKNVHLDIQLKEEELKNKDRKDELRNKIKEIELGNEIEAKKLREVELKKKFKEEIKVEERLRNKVSEEQISLIRGNVEGYKKDLFNLKKEVFELNMELKGMEVKNKMKDNALKIGSLEEKLKNVKSEELKKGLEEDLMKLKLEREELGKKLEQTELKSNHRKAKWRIDELISKRSDEVQILKEKSKEELRKAYEEEEKLKKEMDNREEKLREEFEEELEEENKKGLIERLNIGGSKIAEGLKKLDKGKGKSKKMLKKWKKELEKLTLNETKLKEEQNKNSEKLSRVEGILEKSKELKNIDRNYYGLLSFFKYTLSSKCSKACCGEIEEEYEWERKLGEMEYEYEVNIEKNNSDNSFETKKQFCEKLEIFKLKFEEKYPQNAIEKRLDFETVSEWKDGNKENSMDKRIDKLIKKCLEFKKKVFNIRGIKDLLDLESLVSRLRSFGIITGGWNMLDGHRRDQSITDLGGKAEQIKIPNQPNRDVVSNKVPL
uniref:Uncharacterized protein n=1 Tax=Meloidogyne enterolobii TaxID=390850 RepID=A0A6V7WNR2_MELEN|nr:unnamed protein product [Meloidogyne enterolobii]